MADMNLFQYAASEAKTETKTDSPKEPRFLSVTELTTKIRGTLEPAFTDIWVQGEISNFRPASSGHVYFSLKDGGASISAAIFGWNARKKPTFEIKDGIQVLCHGKLSIYPPRGSYQLIIDKLEPMGAGALQLAFEQLKTKLAAEGLFNPDRKKPLPKYPSQIAIVTSPSGAAIRDMLNILARRAPQIKIVIIPAVVQGEDAPKQITRGLLLAQKYALGEIIVLTRGGGSIEDLWGFNDEGLARTIAASKLPVVSAVGHEIDFTISDFVSDLRAPTPSAAAELVSHHWVDSIRRVSEARGRIYNSIVRDLSVRKTLLQHVAARVVSPKDRLRLQAQMCDELSLRMERAVRVRLDRKRSFIEHWAGKLDALSPLRVLERGYTIVRNPKNENRIIRRASEITLGQELCVTFHDGNKTFQAIE